MIERHGGAGEDREYGQPCEETPVAQCTWRREQADEGQTEGHRGRVHEGVAATEAGLVVVGQGTGQGIRDGVERQRNEQRRSREGARQSQYLVVVEKDKDAEPGVFQPLRELPDPEGELAGERDQTVSLTLACDRHGIGVVHAGFPTSGSSPRLNAY